MSRAGVGNVATQAVNFGSGSYFANQAAFTTIIWFRSPNNSGGFSATLIDQNEIFPSSFFLSLETNGAVKMFYRGATATTFNGSSGTGFDDDRWHWAMVVRRSATDHQWYVDGTSVATSATDPGVVTLTMSQILNSTTNSMVVGGQVARFMVWKRALTLLEGRRAAFLGMDKSGGPMGTVWCELGMPTLEIDLTGNKNHGTPEVNSQIGTSVPPRADYWDIPKYRRPQIKAPAIAAMGAQFVNLGAFNRFGARVG